MKIQMPQLCFTFDKAQRVLSDTDPKYEEIITQYREMILALLKKSLLQVSDRDMASELQTPTLDYQVALAELTYFNAWFGQRVYGGLGYLRGKSE